MGTKLEIRVHSGDQPQYSNAIKINVPQMITFRWSTSVQGVTSAQYNVTDAQPPFGTLMTGVLAGASKPGAAQLFDIDFSAFLPAAATTLHTYQVRMVPMQGRKELSSSPSVEISYANATPPGVR